MFVLCVFFCFCILCFLFVYFFVFVFLCCLVLFCVVFLFLFCVLFSLDSKQKHKIKCTKQITEHKKNITCTWIPCRTSLCCSYSSVLQLLFVSGLIPKNALHTTPALRHRTTLHLSVPQELSISVLVATTHILKG